MVLPTTCSSIRIPGKRLGREEPAHLVARFGFSFVLLIITMISRLLRNNQKNKGKFKSAQKFQYNFLKSIKFSSTAVNTSIVHIPNEHTADQMYTQY